MVKRVSSSPAALTPATVIEDFSGCALSKPLLSLAVSVAVPLLESVVVESFGNSMNSGWYEMIFRFIFSSERFWIFAVIVSLMWSPAPKSMMAGSAFARAPLVASYQTVVSKFAEKRMDKLGLVGSFVSMRTDFDVALV